MIPVTTFAGKKRRGLRPRRLGARELPARCSRAAPTSIAWDDNAETVAQGARAPAFRPPICATSTGRRIAALVLAPGVPLTHPAPHWTVGLARAAGVEVIGDIELFCRERRRHAPDAPFVAITGTNGKSTTTALIAHLLRAAGHDAQLGGNIGTAILSLEPPRAGPRARDRVLVLSDRSRALARSVGRHPAQRHARIISTATARSRTTPP